MAESAKLPVVAVTSSKFTAGVSDIGQQTAEFLDVVDFRAAFLPDGTSWTSDAHFVTYQVVNSFGQLEAKWPRLCKPAPAAIRAVGGDVLSWGIALDYDNVDHEPWTADAWQRFRSRIKELEKCEPIFDYVNAFYTTRNGGRFVFAFDRAIPVEEAEPKARGLMTIFREAGIAVDEGCADWTRLFRLPKVTRGGELTEDSEFFFSVVRPAHRIDPDALPDEGSVSRSMPVTELALDQPTPEQARRFTHDPMPDGSETPTAFAKLARSALFGRDCYACIFEDAPLASKGRRNNTMMRYVAQAIAVLFRTDGSSPQGIYALLLPAVEQLDGDSHVTPSELWRVTCSTWQQHASREAQAKQLQQQSSDDLLDNILRGARTWTNDSRVQGPDNEAKRFLRERLVGIHNTQCYLMSPSGRFDTVDVHKDNLPVRIRELGMLDLLPTERAGKDGPVQIRTSTLLKHSGFMLSDVEVVAGTSLGARVANYGDPSRSVMQLVTNCRDTTIRPRFQAEVHQHMMAMWPDSDTLRRVQAWFGYALAFEDGPICALYLHGVPGSGKKLLAMGLVECLKVKTFASARDFGRFSEPLRRTPVMIVNEGLPKDPTVPDTFRRLVGGDPISCEAKFRAPVHIKVPLRMLITANNQDVLGSLGGANRNLESDDLDALAQRLQVVRVSQGAAIRLRALGGVGHTGGWIARDGGGGSNHVVAQHLMWLYQNRSKFASPGSRMLVEGDPRDGIGNLIARYSGVTPHVCECLLLMLEYRERTNGLVVWEDLGRAFVTVTGVESRLHKEMVKGKPIRMEVNSRNIGRALGTYTVGPASGSTTRLKHPYTNKAERIARWRELNLGLLAKEAVELGAEHKQLRKLLVTSIGEKSYEELVSTP